MSEKEKTILDNLSKSLSLANESQKEYLTGFADGLALAVAGKSENQQPTETNN